jgi:hypothetical protein
VKVAIVAVGLPLSQSPVQAASWGSALRNWCHALGVGMGEVRLPGWQPSAQGCLGPGERSGSYQLGN